MSKIKRIGVLSLAKFQAGLMGLYGLVAGILYSFGGLIIDTLVSYEVIVSTETPGLSYGTVLAFGALIGMPLIAAVFGFVVGAIGAVLYNVVAKWTGGVEMDFED